jgi:hypothetical protein
MADFVKKPEFIEGKQFDLKNVKVQWCFLADPDTKFEHCWKLTARLEESLATPMKQAGFNVKSSKDFKDFKAGDDEYFYIECKSKCKTKEGKENKPPFVKGRDGRTDIDGSIVGNGSTCNVRIFARYAEVSGKLHLPAYLNGVQVVNLVEYNPNAFDSVEEDGEGSGELFPPAA